MMGNQKEWQSLHTFGCMEGDLLHQYNLWRDLSCLALRFSFNNQVLWDQYCGPMKSPPSGWILHYYEDSDPINNAVVNIFKCFSKIMHMKCLANIGPNITSIFKCGTNKERIHIYVCMYTCTCVCLKTILLIY